MHVETLFLKIHLLMHLCVIYMGICTPEEALGSYGTIVADGYEPPITVWVLGTEYRISGRAARVLNPGAISSLRTPIS